MSEDTGRLFCRLVEIMSRLRSPEGCPWDREQTHQTLKKDLVEETYETVDAIDSGDMEELCGELGDLLLQIVFHAELACEKDDFCIDDVLKGINAKLIRRHPHVFADAAASCAEEVIDRWEKIKSGEKGFQGRTSVLDGVPKTLPALSQAMKISKKAARAGFEWPNIDAVVNKLEEEVEELKEELKTGDSERISEEIGDLLFTVVNVARWQNIDPEDSLRQMIRRFSARFRCIEDAAKKSGRSIEDMTIEEMDAVWEAAKRRHQ